MGIYKVCSCSNVFTSIPEDAKELEGYYWFNCSNCDSTLIYPSVMSGRIPKFTRYNKLGQEIDAYENEKIQSFSQVLREYAD